MEKGTIMTIDEKYSYVFTNRCRLVKVPWQQGMNPGKEIQINMKTHETTPHAPTWSRKQRWALAAACLAVILAAGIFFGQGLIINPVYARLSIDVNPSLQLDLDRQLKVQAVHTLNEEAVQIMAGETLIGLPWREAVERWAALLKQRFAGEVTDMLISAVIPDKAGQLLEQLMAMDGTTNLGELHALQVRVIYSQDPAVVRSAKQNGLSIGRQMLLNQASEQNQAYNAQTIAAAQLGDLLRKLLRDGQADQTGMTRRETRSFSETSATQGSTQGSAKQETNGAPQGSTVQSGEGSQYKYGDPQGSTVQSGESSQNQSQYSEPQGSTIHSSEGSQSQYSEPQGTTATYQYTHQNPTASGTGPSTQGTGN
jgi:hypothetical protein